MSGMKKFVLLITVLVIFFAGKIYAQEQEEVREFGKIENSDFEIEAPEEDPDAEAIIIFDIGETRFIHSRDKGLDIKFERVTRIKILKESGLDWANVNVPLYYESYYESENMRKLEGRTYTLENGAIMTTKLDENSVFEEKVNEYWIQKKFAMPAVKVGSIIEYRYEVTSPFVVNLPDWEFQNRIPTIYSKYVVGVTPFYEYTFFLQGATKFDSFKSTDEFWVDKSFATIDYNDLVYEYIMEDVPAFKDEAYITSVEDYIIKLDFQLSKINYTTGGSKKYLTTWEDMNKELLGSDYFGQFIKKSEKYSKKILQEDLILDGLSENEKCKKIVEYVKENFTWNGYNRKYAEKSVKELVNETTGSSAEINLFLVGMLRAAGLRANPVLISTRDHGRINVDYPYTNLFNYVIVLVTIGDNLVLTEGTEPLLAYARIPSKCINHNGLVLNEEGEYWIDLASSVAFPSVSHKTFLLKVDTENGFVKAEIVEQTNEYMALKNKKVYSDDEEYFVTFNEKKGFENVEVIEVINDQKPGKAFTIKYQGDFPIEYFDDKIIIPPFLNSPLSENQLKQPDRKYPVDMNFKKRWYYVSTIEFPEGYTLLEAPEDFLVDNELVKIEIKSKVLPNSINIEGTIFYNKAIYPPKDYKSLKYYLNEIIKKFNEKVVLKEIEETSINDSEESTEL